MKRPPTVLFVDAMLLCLDRGDAASRNTAALLEELILLRQLEKSARAACAELDPTRDEAQVLTAIRAELEQLGHAPEGDHDMRARPRHITPSRLPTGDILTTRGRAAAIGLGAVIAIAWLALMLMGAA